VDVVFEFGKHTCIRKPMLSRAGLAVLHGADFFNVVNRNAFLEALAVDLAVAPDRGFHPLGQCIRTAHSDAVEAA
jgi:hypothetical protein